MKIKMIALAPLDGCAFIIENGRLYLLTPPYRTRYLVEASDDDFTGVISRYPFRKCNVSFKSMAKAVRYLKYVYVKEMEKMGLTLPDPDELKSLLEFASREVLTDYLDKMENEFIPNRNFDVAESLALELLRLKKIKEDSSLYDKTLTILKQCRNESTAYAYKK